MTIAREKGPPQNLRAERICEARQATALNDAQIADHIGVARTSVLNWQVRGSINLDNLRAFADITGFTLHWLAFGEGPKTITSAILSELNSLCPDVDWSIEHAELLRTLYMKMSDGTLDEPLLHHVNNIIDGLTSPALATTKQVTDEMVDSGAKAAPYLNRDAVQTILKAALGS